MLIGIDPHKGSHTAVVMDDEVEIARVHLRADRHQLTRLLTFAELAALIPGAMSRA